MIDDEGIDTLLLLKQDLEAAKKQGRIQWAAKKGAGGLTYTQVHFGSVEMDLFALRPADGVRKVQVNVGPPGAVRDLHELHDVPVSAVMFFLQQVGKTFNQTQRPADVAAFFKGD